MTKKIILVVTAVLIVVGFALSYLWLRNLWYEKQSRALLQAFVETQLDNLPLGTASFGRVECYPVNSNQNSCISATYSISTDVCDSVYKRLTKQENSNCKESTETRFVFRNRIVWVVTQPPESHQEATLLLFVE